MAVVFVSPLTAGNTLIVTLGLATSGTWVDHISDSQNHTYTLQTSSTLFNVSNGAPGGSIHVYSVPVIQGSTPSLSIYLSGGTAHIVTAVREVSGVIAAPVGNQVKTQFTGGTQPFQSSSITSPQPNCLAFSWIAAKSSTAPAASGQFIHGNTQTSLGGSIGIGIADLLLADPQSLGSYWNLGGTQNVFTGLIFLKGFYDDESLNLGVLGCG